MSEKPIHVQVAEALGWKVRLSKHGHFIVTHGEGAEVPGHQCEEAYGYRNPNALYDSYTGKKLPAREDWWNDCSHVPIFHEDWSVVGPLIQKYGINLERAQACRADGGPYAAWRWALPVDKLPPVKHWGDTPQLAVCNFILAFSAVGTLATPQDELRQEGGK
jgi:hypothetical protein